MRRRKYEVFFKASLLYYKFKLKRFNAIHCSHMQISQHQVSDWIKVKNDNMTALVIFHHSFNKNKSLIRKLTITFLFLWGLKRLEINLYHFVFWVGQCKNVDDTLQHSLLNKLLDHSLILEREKEKF